MNARNYVIPAMSVLSMGMTTACGNPVVGDWGLTNVTYGSYSTDYPYTYTYTAGDGTVYNLVIDYRMLIDSDLSGDFVGSYTYTIGSGDPEVYTYTYGLTVTETASKTYDIVIDWGEGDTLDMGCTIDGAAMACTDPDGAQLSWAQ